MLPGATPPLIGWAAACGRLDSNVAAFCNRISLAVSALHGHRLDLREDYARAGYFVLPGQVKDRFVAWQSSFQLGTSPSGSGPQFAVSWNCLPCALVLGTAFLLQRALPLECHCFCKAVAFASILYLPLFTLLALDKK